MNRRDTIIVAVLVNAALLMILFATAIRSDQAEPEQSGAAQLVQAPPPVKVEEDLLNQYVSAVPTLAEKEEEIVLPVVEEVEIVQAEPPPKPVETPAFVSVTVKNGDFLEKIANANHTTVSAIMNTNNLTSTQLKIGQVLKVPLSKENAVKKAPTQLSEGEFYVVQQGDSPWLIASRNNLRLDELLRLNDLDEQKARRLRPGDRLRIR